MTAPVVTRPEVGDLVVEIDARAPRLGTLVDFGRVRDAEGVEHEIPMERLVVVPAMELQLRIARAVFVAGDSPDDALDRAARLLVGDWYEPDAD
jgi:hypothetical protein